MFDELHIQNHEITELSNVLQHLFADRAMCDTKTACELLFRYLDKVKLHLGDVDQLYTILLANPDQQVKNIANNFMAGEIEIKRLIGQYVKHRCDKKRYEIVVDDYGEFLQDTKALFKMVEKRVQDETERLYPLVRTEQSLARSAA